LKIDETAPLVLPLDDEVKINVLIIDGGINRNIIMKADVEMEV
jgi:hypothetical protein